MSKLPEEFYDEAKKEEVLGSMYEYRTLLSPIEINSSNYEEFRQDIEYLIKFNEAIGKQIITLSLGVTSLYNIDNDIKNNCVSTEQLFIINQVQSFCGVMSFSLYELQLINEKFLDKNEFIIEPNEYLFVAYMLLRIYNIYSNLLYYINNLLNFDEEFIDSIDVCNKTILSPKFQQMRALFRVTEWQRNIMEMSKKESISVH